MTFHQYHLLEFKFHRHRDGMETLLILCVFAVAGLVKGLSGLGLPTLGIALLGLALPPAEAAALIALPALLTNVWQGMRGGFLFPLLRRMAPLLAGIVLGTALGGLWRPDPHLARLILAEALMLYAMLGLLDVVPELPPGLEPWLGGPAGLITGMVTAVTGVFVLPALPYLQALRLPPAQMIQALGISFTLSSAALVVSLASRGALALPQVGLSLAATLPAIAGMVLGGRLRPLIPLPIFRRVFFVCLFAVGVHLLLA